MSRRRRKTKLKEVIPKLSHVYAYFWPEIRAYRGRIVASLLALLGAVAFRLLEPWPMKFFLDYVLRPTPDSGWLGEFQPQQILLAVAVSTVVVAVARAYFDYVSRVGFFVVGNKVVVKVRDRLYRHLQRLSLGFHSRARTGDLIVRVSRDVSLIRDVTATAMLPLVASVSVLAGMICVMLFLSWQLTLLALLTVPLFWLTTVRLGKRIRNSARKQRAREGAMATTAAETLGAIRVIQAMNLEDRFAKAFGELNSQSQKEDLRASRLSVRLGRTIDVLLAFSTALVLWFGGKLALSGQLSAGDIIVFLTYLKRSFKPAQEFAKYIARLSKAAASGERVIEVLETKREIKDRADAVELNSVDGKLTFENVHFGHEEERPVLVGLTVEIQAGELVAIVGPSGSGKTTLLNLVLRFFDPQTGRVLIDSQDVKDVKIASLRAQTSSVMQEPLLLADSVFQNIACGTNEATEAQVVAAARLALADEFICQIPGGYDAMVGERGATLSRGQQQRIAIARAAVRHSPILLLDEPTTGLDEESEAKVLEALLRLSQGRTTLLVTHNLSLAARADRILMIDGGNVAEQGTHEELIGRRGKYATWHAQQRGRGDGNTRFSIVS